MNSNTKSVLTQTEQLEGLMNCIKTKVYMIL